jgi:hypothetical protein
LSAGLLGSLGGSINNAPAQIPLSFRTHCDIEIKPEVDWAYIDTATVAKLGWPFGRSISHVEFVQAAGQCVGAGRADGGEDSLEQFATSKGLDRVVARV